MEDISRESYAPPSLEAELISSSPGATNNGPTAHLENVTMAASNLVSMRTTSESEAVGAPPRKRGRPASGVDNKPYPTYPSDLATMDSTSTEVHMDGGHHQNLQQQQQDEDEQTIVMLTGE